MKEFLTVAEVAEKEQVTRVTVYSWIKRGLKYETYFRGTVKCIKISVGNLNNFLRDARGE